MCRLVAACLRMVPRCACRLTRRARRLACWMLARL
nr:MAG TPA: hypothetical protein [Caudoviricetes sp.]DAX70345.1 MAG TPA: hypothetical protein [Caudoviricetes sp.]